MKKTDINSRSALIVILMVVIIGVAYITLAGHVNHNQTGSNSPNIAPAHDNTSSVNNTNTSIKNETNPQNSTNNTKTINQTQNVTTNSTKKVSAKAFTVSNAS